MSITQQIAIISDSPAQWKRLNHILTDSARYDHLPDIEEIKSWQCGKIVVIDYKVSVAAKLSADIAVLKRCHPGILVVVIVEIKDKKVEAAAITANADVIIKRPYSDDYLLYVLEKLAVYGKLFCATAYQLSRYCPAGINQPENAVLGLLDAKGELRPFRDLERDIYSFALDHHHENYAAIIRSLKIGRSTWYRLLEKFKLGRM